MEKLTCSNHSSRTDDGSRRHPFAIDCPGTIRAGDASFLVIESPMDPLMILSFDPDVVYNERESK